MNIENGFYGFFVSSPLRLGLAKKWKSFFSRGVIPLNIRKSKEKTYKPATFTQNCFPSSNKINEASRIGARGGSEISALEQPNETVGS